MTAGAAGLRGAATGKLRTSGRAPATRTSSQGPVRE
jgi:hypothetical protein